MCTSSTRERDTNGYAYFIGDEGTAWAVRGDDEYAFSEGRELGWTLMNKGGFEVEAPHKPISPAEAAERFGLYGGR